MTHFALRIKVNHSYKFKTKFDWMYYVKDRQFYVAA
jgi:hypothetical protein